MILLLVFRFRYITDSSLTCNSLRFHTMHSYLSSLFMLSVSRTGTRAAVATDIRGGAPSRDFAPKQQPQGTFKQPQNPGQPQGQQRKRQNQPPQGQPQNKKARGASNGNRGGRGGGNQQHR